MESAWRLFARDETITSDYTVQPSVTNLLFALLTLVFFGLGLAGILYILRRRRAGNKQLLPIHQKTSNHRRLTITATPYVRKTEPIHVYDEKRSLIENSTSPPDSPVPEIRVTFPEEEDPSGRKKGGRVVVVRIGDSGSIGMEPVAQEGLPSYQSSETSRFQSLDLNRMGGLKEQNVPRKWP